MGVVISVEHNYIFIVPLKKSNNENWTFLNGRMQLCDYLAVFVLSSVFKCSLALLRKLFSVLVIQLIQPERKILFSFSRHRFIPNLYAVLSSVELNRRMSFSVFLYPVKVNED